MKTTFNILLGCALTMGVLSSCGNSELKNATNAASLMAATSTSTEAGKPQGDSPSIDFKETTVQFGTLKQGDKFEYDFEFTNNGDAPLLITNAKGSCGCTVPNYTREPIAPGASDKIHVVFNSAGKKGQQHKTVTLQTNASTTPVVLHLQGTVVVSETK